MILTPEEEQRPVVASDSAQHFTHDNGVIAAFVTLHNLALEMADSAVQDGGAVTAPSCQVKPANLSAPLVAKRREISS